MNPGTVFLLNVLTALAISGMLTHLIMIVLNEYVNSVGNKSEEQ